MQKAGTKKLTPRGRHLTLPLAGDAVSEVCFGTSRLVALVLRDSAGDESLLQIEEAVTLTRHGLELYLPGSRPGPTYEPMQLGPLLGLLGATVEDAWAHHEGALEVTFSNGDVLRVVPESGGEVWHFQYPRPGRPPSGDVSRHVSLHGDHGRLI